MSQTGSDFDARSAPSSPQFQLNNAQSQSQPPGIRRATSQWSEHHNAGTSYFPPPSPRRTNPNSTQPTSPFSSRYRSASASNVHTTRRGEVRSASLASSRHREARRGPFSEEDEDEAVEREREAYDASNLSGGEDDEDDRDDRDEEAQTPRLRDQPLEDDDPVTLKERQSLINDEHPFGLPIWKPALYRKSRTVTREAETALHGVPSPSRDLLLPGNILWTILFGWWLSICIIIPSFILSIIPFGGNKYAPVVYGLGWYLFWPFGRYVEGDLPPSPPESRDEGANEGRSRTVSGYSTAGTIRAHGSQEDSANATIRAQPQPPTGHAQSTSWNSAGTNEHTPLLPPSTNSSGTTNVKSYGALPTSHNYGILPTLAPTSEVKERWARFCYYWFLTFNVIPSMLIVCTICWACVFTIPMAKLLWELVKHMYVRPEAIRFCSAPKIRVGEDEESTEASPPHNSGDTIIYTHEEPTGNGTGARESGGSLIPPPTHAIKRATLRAGQIAPSGKPNSTVLLCIYRAVGTKYYKYTVGGVNILFVNLIPIVFFVILDGLILLPMVEKREHHGEHVHPLLAFIASQATIFILSLASVIPLSYFIGMAVASISAQSSIGMGAVINATFGSIIEIILYAIALTQGKGKLVEGSIVGSILAGVLLMPGASMCSGALRRKEQGFNAKSASVTSTMLIMAIFGTLTPTLFYQIYGNFTLICDGCPKFPVEITPLPSNTSSIPSTFAGPDSGPVQPPWHCKRCYYSLPDPVTDPFYQQTVKPLMYFCASILVLSYLIGLWFSLRTHASQIWQNPRQLMEPHPLDLGAPGAQAGRMSLYHRLLQMPSGLPTYRRPESLNRDRDRRQESLTRDRQALRRKDSTGTTTTTGGSIRGVPSNAQSMPASQSGTVRAAPPPILTGDQQQQPSQPPSHITLPPSPSVPRRLGNLPTGVGYTPIIEHMNQAAKHAVEPIVLPAALAPETRINITTDDFTRAVAVATVSALRQGAADANRARASGVTSGFEGHNSGHGGHDAPSWSRLVSASVLLSCTLLYAIIAEILVDVVDVVLKGSGIDEKLLGVTLFALVPNTTEFMNAVSFAINGNISLSMEIGSAYALQVCLLQIPAMVAFSAWYDPRHMGTVADTFTLIFPRWDVIAIVLSIFLLTYTYIEAKSNYHRGSILILSYLVMFSGFYFAPQDKDEIVAMPGIFHSAAPLLYSMKTYALSLFTI